MSPKNNTNISFGSSPVVNAPRAQTSTESKDDAQEFLIVETREKKDSQTTRLDVSKIDIQENHVLINK